MTSQCPASDFSYGFRRRMKGRRWSADDEMDAQQSERCSQETGQGVEEVLLLYFAPQRGDRCGIPS